MQRRDQNMRGGGGPDGGQHTVIVLSDDDNDEEDEALQQAIQLSLGLSSDAPHKPCISHQRKKTSLLVEEDEALKKAIALSLASTSEDSLHPPHTLSESVEDEELERAIKLSLGEDASASNIGKSRTAHHKKDHRQNLRNEGAKSRINEDRSWGEGNTFYLNRIEGLCEVANANTLSFTQILQPVCTCVREKMKDCELMCECPSSLRAESTLHCNKAEQRGLGISSEKEWHENLWLPVESQSITRISSSASLCWFRWMY